MIDFLFLLLNDPVIDSKDVTYTHPIGNIWLFILYTLFI